MVGEKWTEEIEHHIRTSDFFIVLLSQESIRSEMVVEEVKRAYERTKPPTDSLTILPVRVAFRGDLPYDLAAYLGRIQYASWGKGASFKAIGDQLVAAIEKRVALPEGDTSEKHDFSEEGIQDLADEKAAPLPSMDPRLTGAVQPDSPFYIERAADAVVLNQVRGEGTTTIIKGARQMGKSSLLARANAAARAQQRQIFYLDFQLLDDAELESLKLLFQSLAYGIEKAFNTPVKARAFWDDFLGVKQNLTNFIEHAVLSRADTPVVFLLDEVDRVFDHPYRDDFFSTLRVWHNRRATQKTWNNLNLVIAHSTDPNLWIQDMSQSPFNVGRRVELNDFDEAQVATLNERYRSPLQSDREIQALMDLTGGQPYLVQMALYTLAENNWSLQDLQAVASDERGPFIDHLRWYLWRLQRNEALRQSLKEILNQGACEDEVHFQRLRAGGLVKGTSHRAARIRCQLYADYLQGRL